MDEYSLWLRTNVSSARQDQVRAFADDLGDLLALRSGSWPSWATPIRYATTTPGRGRVRGCRGGARASSPSGPRCRADGARRHPRRRSRRTSSRKRHRPQRRPPVGVGERARCPARFQRSRPCPHPRNERRRRNLHDERSPALAERASRRSRPSSRASWGRHFHYSSKRTQLRISRRTRRCPRAPTPRAWRAT